MILYLHGFRSSPQSFKARLIGERLRELGRADDYLCPQLPPSPRAAVALAAELIERYSARSPTQQQVALIGSSLGGYYATYLAERYGCRAALLNPAVRPPRDLEQYVGTTTAYHSDETFEFKPEYVEELRSFAVQHITRPERYFLLAATGDEVLDWREMTAHYPGARQEVIQGSDHGIAEFADYVDRVLAFCDQQSERPN